MTRLLSHCSLTAPETCAALTASERAAVTSSRAQTCPRPRPLCTARPAEPPGALHVSVDSSLQGAGSQNRAPSALHGPGDPGPSLCWQGYSLPVAQAMDRPPWVWRGKESGLSPASSITDRRPSTLHERGVGLLFLKEEALRGPGAPGQAKPLTSASHLRHRRVRVEGQEGEGCWVLDRFASLLGYVLPPAVAVTEHARAA